MNIMLNELPPFPINLHLTSRCNMFCRGCFAFYGSAPELDLQGWIRTLETIRSETESRYRLKVTFAGGEPTLLPFLPRLLERARELDMATGLITNGSLLDDSYLDRIARTVDWLGISVDSLYPNTNAALGRSCLGGPILERRYLRIAAGVKERGIRLKINTVVNRLNLGEDFFPFISVARPDRWKVMQLLLVAGQNDDARSLRVSSEEYRSFVDRHSPCETMVVEPAEAMLASYVMIDPSGRPYGNAGGQVSFGSAVTEKGLLGQLEGLGYEYTKTAARKGLYF